MQQFENEKQPPNPYSAPLTVSQDPIAAEVEELGTGPFNPFLAIWTRPRRTVRRIVSEDPERHVVLLVCLAGIGETLDRASMRSAGETLQLSAIIGIAVVFGPLGGLLSLWIFSHVLRLTGAWIGGAGNREHIKTAIAWAYVPAVFVLPLWSPQLLLYGSEMFTDETPRLDAQPLLWVPIILIGLAEIVCAVWGFVLLCNTVAEVQGYRSARRGLGNIVLAALVVAVPLMILVVGLISLGR